MSQFLKELFGEDSLTFEQFSEKLSQNGSIKLANISDGGYVEKEQYERMLFDCELKSSLKSAGLKNPKTIMSLLDFNNLKLENGNISGLQKQLAAIREENAFLFEETREVPAFSRPTPGFELSSGEQGTGKANNALRSIFKRQ